MNDAENNGSALRNSPYRNTIGSIVSWALFRMALVIFVALVVYEYVYRIDYVVWWTLTLLSLYAIQYQLYKQETQNVINGTLCSSCRHFEPTGVLCSILDEHVTENDVPCEGLRWEPKSIEDKMSEDI